MLYASESASACGKGGAACASCANGVCDTTTGTCSCDANTCLNGCCNGGTSGTCDLYASQTSSACGSGGASCTACTSPATCTAHTDGVGQSFDDCTPLCDAVGPGGTGTSCTGTGAQDACDAYSAVHGGSACTLYTCGAGGSKQYIYMSDTVTSGDCSSWSYYVSGAPYVGQVYQNTNTTCTYGCASYNTGIYWK